MPGRISSFVGGVASAEALECESISSDVVDLRLLLFLPKDRALFQSVRARLGLQKFGFQAENLLQELVPGADGDLQSQLGNLPHIDEAKYNTREYAALEKEAYNLSKIKGPLDVRLSQYLHEVLQRFVATRESEMRQDILFLMISMTLRNAIACGLSFSPESGPVYDQVRAVLNGDEFLRPLVAKEVFVALKALSIFLRGSAKETRLAARSICEVFRIPLELPQMLSLSIDGVKPEEKKEVDKLVLVIGTTGSGKSTLINCLSGIEYELCEDINFGSTFLQPKEGQPVPPAKVGHDVSSQTLYPQIIPASDGSFYFCDCPGFDDNRRGDEAICAALGVPLAVHYSKKISAIILTVNYELTNTSTGRNSSLRLLNQTLSGIIKLPEHFHNFPLFFAITRPPEKGGPFRTSLLRKQTANRISSFFELATQQAKSLPIKEKQLAKFEEDLLVSITSMGELQILKEGAMGFGKARTGLSILASLLGGMELVEVNRVEKKVAELKAGWRAKGYHERSVLELGDTLRRALELQCREKGLSFLAEIGRQIDVWREGRINLETQIKALRQEIEHIRGEEAIMGLMHKNSANIFIIRGFAGTNPADEEDDLKRLYQAASAETSEIPRYQFLFDPNNRAFDAVKHWIEGFSGHFSPKLQQMIQLHDDIGNRLTVAMNEARSFIDLTKEEILSEVKGDSDNDIARNLKIKIDKMATDLKQLTEGQTRLREESQLCEDEVKSIMAAPARDFRSELKLEQPGWTWFTFGWGWLFEFRRQSTMERIASMFGKAAEPNIPIERVEFSCVLDEQKRVLFKTAIEDQFVEDRDLVRFAASDPSIQLEEKLQNVFAVKPPQDSSVYGHFVLRQCNLKSGIFSLKYYSDEERQGRCAIRVFVLPRHMPVEKARKRQLESKIEAKRATISSMILQSTKLTKIIANDKEYLALLIAGNHNQTTKILRIVELLSRLGVFQEQEVINLFGLDESVLASFQWLRNPANFEEARSILWYKGSEFPEAFLGIDLRTLLAVMGVNFTLRMAVVEDKHEAAKLKMKPGEALLYKERNGKMRILFSQRVEGRGIRMQKKKIDQSHEHYNILLSSLEAQEDAVESNNQVLRIVYGILQQKILQEKKNILDLNNPESQAKLTRLVQTLPRNFLLHMHAVSRTTGFTVASIHKVLTGLKQQRELKDAAMQTYKKLEREKAIKEFFFAKLRSLYEANETQFLTVQEIIALLNCGNQRAAGFFLRCYQELRSKDLSQIKFSVSEELMEFVEREVVDQKNYYQQKNNFSNVEWAKVVSGFKAQAILWVGRSPENTRFEFETKIELSTASTELFGVIGDAARNLLLVVASNESYRATLAPECLAFMRREHRLPDSLAAKCDQLKQNAQLFEAEAKDCLSELGLEHKFVNLQYFATAGFRERAKGNAKSLAFSQAIRDHLATAIELEESLQALSRSYDAFVEFCKSLPEGNQAGPQTLALVAKLSHRGIMIWEQQHLSNSKVLNLKASSVTKSGERAMHFLLLPSSEDFIYKYAMLLPRDEESVGPEQAAEDEKRDSSSLMLEADPQLEDAGADLEQGNPPDIAELQDNLSEGSESDMSPMSPLGVVPTELEMTAVFHTEMKEI